MLRAQQISFMIVVENTFRKNYFEMRKVPDFGSWWAQILEHIRTFKKNHRVYVKFWNDWSKNYLYAINAFQDLAVGSLR
jgi:hypothetical protein